ncbi:35867_t:CDS:2 [Gigaspora margarita]|uniref:35867_t:CDS:1 n=1 Tax=Gigaspora margarita TaxID=4874 RepID=A0ABN7V7M7_GIGMA|nr:35867_t:CDS:2 [Gigaspora margarita]
MGLSPLPNVTKNMASIEYGMILLIENKYLYLSKNYAVTAHYDEEYDFTVAAWASSLLLPNENVVLPPLLPNENLVNITQDGNIILYGGSTINATYGYAGNIFSDVSVLNTNTWTWSIPSISGINAPPSLTYHSAVLYQTYMIIAFGNYFNCFVCSSI